MPGTINKLSIDISGLISEWYTPPLEWRTVERSRKALKKNGMIKGWPKWVGGDQ